MKLSTPLETQDLAPDWTHSGFEYGVIHYRPQKRALFLDELSLNLKLSIGFLQELLELGSIYINQKRFSLFSAEDLFQFYVEPCDLIRIHSKPRRYFLNIPTEQMILKIFSDFIVVNKPAGIPCHPTVDNCKENLIEFLQSYLKQKIYLTHRLDVATSGLMIMGLNPDFQKAFNRQLSEGCVQKIYSAQIEKSLQPLEAKQMKGMWTDWLKKSPKAPKEVISESAYENLSSDEERLQYLKCQLEVLECHGSHLKIKLITGRTHQIRAQLARRGLPIQGDILYGATTQLSTDSLAIQLCAESIQFPYYLNGEKLSFHLNRC